ncbi:MAG: enoyl-CoA hydratase-related protein [Chloroflexi bacterium]|nr:enoyl-CoA hydratase-related protein [Chloroflexota bacterium]
MSAEFKTILYEKKGNAAWITLNRPEVLNAQNDLLRAEVVEALETARDDDEVYVIAITGAGERAFSAGADISEFPKRYPADIIKWKGRKGPYMVIREMPKPVIAAVNGLAFGGGCEIVLACDCVIAVEDAQFGQPEVRVGVIPGGGGTQILPRLIGEKKAKELIFSGRPITAAEALQMGMINQVVPRDKLIEATEKMIGDFLKNSPVILKLAKLAVNKSLETTLSVGMDCERDFFALCFGTEDQKEGARAFLEKRKPSYKGK